MSDESTTGAAEQPPTRRSSRGRTSVPPIFPERSAEAAAPARPAVERVAEASATAAPPVGERPASGSRPAPGSRATTERRPSPEKRAAPAPKAAAARDASGVATPNPASAPRPAPRAIEPQRVLIAGASGMIGTELVRQLEDSGHTILRLVRRHPQAENEFHWAPASRMLDFSLLDKVDAVINLAGASISRLPWTTGYKKQILDSRVQATQTLTDAMRMASKAPRVLLNASAVGFYGDRPGERLTEESSKGEGFLSDVVAEWERSAHLAPESTRVVTFRTGLVIGHGGALKPLIPLTKLGLAGPLGTGGQHWPWISLYDEAAAIVHLLGSTLDGPVNLAGPTPATADRLMHRLADDLHRPYKLAVPERVITLALRDAGEELLLSSQKLVPERLLADGFVFRHETVDQAIDWVVAN